MFQDEDSDHEDMKKRIPSATPGRKLSASKQRKLSATSSKGSVIQPLASGSAVDLKLDSKV